MSKKRKSGSEETEPKRPKSNRYIKKIDQAIKELEELNIEAAKFFGGDEEDKDVRDK